MTSQLLTDQVRMENLTKLVSLRRSGRDNDCQHVSGLDPHVNELLLLNFFSPHGEIASVRLNLDRNVQPRDKCIIALIVLGNG
jgi:hypothetical protein